MDKRSFVIYGAGGHAKVVIDLIFTLSGKVECIFDDDPEALNSVFFGIPVFEYNASLFPAAEMIVAVGNNECRNKIVGAVEHKFATLIHPTAYVSSFATIGAGTIILANATVQVGAVVGEHTIINTGACVDHDTQIGNYVHIASLAYLGGNATIMDFSNIRPGVTIKRSVIIPQSSFID